MDKNEQKLKFEEIKRALHEKKYDTAATIADSIDIKKIKDNNLLNIMADAYELSGDYDEAKKVLLAAYENTTTGRHIAYRLCLLSIKTKDFAAAKDYYEDFVEMAPRDTSRFVLRYKMAKAQNKPIEELIVILEEYVNLDMEERWAYELAKLYHMIGDKSKCVDICDEICLWFAEGKYVFKAMDLKKMYSPLTPAQQEKYDENKRKIAGEAEKAARQAKELKPFEAKIDIIQDIPEIKIEPQIAEEDIQAVVADGMKEIFANKSEILEENAKNSIEGSDKLGETRVFGQSKETRDKLGETKIFGRMSGEMEEIIFNPQQNEIGAEDKNIEEILTQNSDVKEDKKDIESEVKNAEQSDKSDKLEEPGMETEADKEMKEETEQQKPQEKAEVDLDKEENEISENQKMEDEEPETISDMEGVADILRQLQARGILKAETVNQAVSIIDEAVTINEEQEVTAVKDEPDAADKKEKPESEQAVEALKMSEGKDVEMKIPEGKDVETEAKVEMSKAEEVESEVKTPDIEAEQEDKENVEAEEITSVQNSKTAEDVSSEIPVFDLDFVTEELPTAEELSKAADTMPQKEVKDEILKENADAEETTAEEHRGDKTKVSAAGINGLKVKNAVTPKVEIIAGAGIVEEGELEILKKTEEKEEDKAESTDKTDSAVKVSETYKDESTAETDKVDNAAEINNTDEPDKDGSEAQINESDKADNETEKETMKTTKALYNEQILPEMSIQKNTGDDKADNGNSKITEEVSPQIILTDDELSAFKNYLNVEGFESNIKDVLRDLIENYTPNGKSCEGNIIITGSEKTGKTTLAIEIIKLVNSKRGRRNRKLAKVSAAALNRRGFRNALNKLLGSDLIIENAELLGPMTLSEIIDVSGMFTDDMIIILEGETEGMTKILNESQRVSQVFNHVITVREYDIKEWAEYGKRYAVKNGYKLDELANLAFYKAIDDFFGTNKGIGKKDVESIVDRAISKSGRIGRKLKGIFASKKDDEGLIILVESDFNV